MGDPDAARKGAAAGPAGRSVSAVIPTKNAGRTLLGCLASLAEQTHPISEIIVVDSLSTDETPRIACTRARLISRRCGMTMGRLLGAEASKGDYVLSLDADQLLDPRAVEQALATGRPAVALGEQSTGSGVVAWLNEIDRRGIEGSWQANLDPLRGSIRPRFFRRDLLLRALRAIPAELVEIEPAPYSEDSLIYLHTGLQPEEVGYVPRALRHVEAPLLAYLRKWRGYGISAQVYRGTQWEGLVNRRGKRGGSLGIRAAAIPALLLKAVPFAIGYNSG
ncbi:MAG: glycosyltransferase family 2 protein [Thermoplasmata archaeon]|nr:glycosyltransferase family 2 protein [Thermoplasmata archaeon]